MPYQLVMGRRNAIEESWMWLGSVGRGSLYVESVLVVVNVIVVVVVVVIVVGYVIESLHMELNLEEREA